MRLSQKVLLSTAAIVVSFSVLLAALLFAYSGTVSLSTQYIEGTQPARAAIEHLLTTVYDDFLLVEQYLLVEDYREFSEFDLLLSHSEEQCEALTEEVDELIEFGDFEDSQAITSYRTAVLVYSSLQRSRDRLLQLHKESLATSAVPKQEIIEERERFIELMQESSSLFATSLEQLNMETIALQGELSQKTQMVRVLLILLLFSFLVLCLTSAYFLVSKLTQPLDQMSKTSIEFSKGNYGARVEETSQIVELSSLQQQLNRVYSLIDSTFSTADQKEEAAKHLLPNHYKNILDFVHLCAEEGRVLTIKDLKKHFDLTHPTMVSRLRYLEENGYIKIKKQGRSKCIFEVK